jgi:hypothetical protein
MITEKDIPKEWVDLLLKFQTIHSKVVLAGGSLRDLDHGLDVKDLDFFVACGSESEATALNKLLGGKEPEQNDTDAWYPESMREIILVTNMDVEGLPPIQLIFVNWSIQYITQRFDYGLCQISFNGKYLERSKGYLEDHDDKVFRLIRSESPLALASSVHRFSRWVPRYPSHKWILGVDLNFTDMVSETIC